MGHVQRGRNCNPQQSVQTSFTVSVISFILYSDTSIEGTGSSLWQIHGGKPRLIGYANKHPLIVLDTALLN